MKKVLVLSGGLSEERDVSLHSGQAVATALTTAGYDVATYDPAIGMDGLSDLLASVDVVFPALHGEGGEDGTLQEYLEKMNKPFVGSGSAASKLCYDKQAYKIFLIDNNFPVPKGEVIDIEHFYNHPLSLKPFVLKPNDGGSSIDTLIVRNTDNVSDEVLKQIFSRHNHMLLEELIEGTESTVAILGSQALPVIEIIPPKNEEFDYENKYNGRTQELCPPSNIPNDLQTKASQLALAIHNLTGCKGMSRTDIMISSRGSMVVLETNTIPGLTDQSLLPKAAKVAGIEMPELVDYLVKDAVKDF